MKRSISDVKQDLDTQIQEVLHVTPNTMSGISLEKGRELVDKFDKIQELMKELKKLM